MNIEDFTKQMQSLLAMQKEFSRIKSENMLFRQQLEDAKNREKELIEKHQKELFEISTGNIKPQKFSEDVIDNLITELQDWSDDLHWLRDREIDNSNSCSSEYYKKEHEAIDDARSNRHTIIQQIQTLLQKSAGIE